MPPPPGGQPDRRPGIVIREGHRFTYVVILLVTVCAIGLGILVRSQNLDIAALSESMATLSSTVRDLARQRTAEIQPTGEKVVRLANQASTNCQDKNGQLAIAKRPDGGEYGLCLFGPDHQCEEWALFRGECPAGGVDISQYGHPADVYCAVTGNKVDSSLIPGRAGKCTVKGTACSAQTFYETGECLADSQ